MKHLYRYATTKENWLADKKYFKNTKKSLWKCMECHINTFASGHYYMLKDNLWKQITSNYFKGHLHEKGMLCLNCVEKRLGRKLQEEDFDLTIPINWDIIKKLNNRNKDGTIKFPNILYNIK